MSNIIHVNFAGHVAPESDGVALVECVQQVIAEFGEYEFAMTLAEANQVEDNKLAA